MFMIQMVEFSQTEKTEYNLLRKLYGNSHKLVEIQYKTEKIKIIIRKTSVL